MNARNGILIALLVLISVGLYMWLSGSSRQKHNWSRTLNTGKKEPYDLSLFIYTLKNTLGSKYHEINGSRTIESVYDKMQEEETPATYAFVGKQIMLTDTEMETLVRHARNGGTVFISSESIPEELFMKLPGLQEFSMNSVYKDSVHVLFYHPLLKDTFSFINHVKDKNSNAYWQYFQAGNSSGFANDAYWADKDKLAEISAMDGNTDFLYVKIGDGKIILHANPVFFGNYYLKDSSHRKYLRYVLSHLPDNELWFDFNGGIYRENVKEGFTQKSIFGFLDQNAALKYAWWLLVIAMMLFIITGGRRKQRSIPLINPPSNNSLSLAESLGYFYLTQNKNALVFKREWNQFLNFLRYQLRIGFVSADDKTLKKIIEKSGVQENTVKEIFSMHARYHIFSELTNSELMETNQKFTKFYTEYYKNGKSADRTKPGRN